MKSCVSEPNKKSLLAGEGADVWGGCRCRPARWANTEIVCSDEALTIILLLSVCASRDDAWRAVFTFPVITQIWTITPWSHPTQMFSWWAAPQWPLVWESWVQVDFSLNSLNQRERKVGGATCLPPDFGNGCEVWKTRCMQLRSSCASNK